MHDSTRLLPLTKDIGSADHQTGRLDGTGVFSTPPPSSSIRCDVSAGVSLPVIMFPGMIFSPRSPNETSCLTLYDEPDSHKLPRGEACRNTRHTGIHDEASLEKMCRPPLRNYPPAVAFANSATAPGEGSTDHGTTN